MSTSNSPQPNESVAAVLNRFPGPVVLPSSRWKWGKIFAIGASFVAIGFFLVQQDRPERQFVAWTLVLFFGVVMLLAAYQLIPGVSRMTLDTDGFEVRGFRYWRSSWCDVEKFAVYTFRNVSGVVYEDRKRAPSLLDRTNRFLSGGNGWLPDTYGLRAEELVQLMTTWRERALDQSGLPR